MTIARWTPPVAPTRQEQFLLKRLGRVRKLLGFLRLHRHELFDDAFQEELASMYRATGAGKEARPPGRASLRSASRRRRVRQTLWSCEVPWLAAPKKDRRASGDRSIHADTDFLG